MNTVFLPFFAPSALFYAEFRHILHYTRGWRCDLDGNNDITLVKL